LNVLETPEKYRSPYNKLPSLQTSFPRELQVAALINREKLKHCEVFNLPWTVI